MGGLANIHAIARGWQLAAARSGSTESALNASFVVEQVRRIDEGLIRRHRNRLRQVPGRQRSPGCDTSLRIAADLLFALSASSTQGSEDGMFTQNAASRGA
jgi:hypothetical protein